MAKYFLKNCGPRSVRFNLGLTSMLAVVGFLALAVARSDAAAPGNVTTNTYGSGKLYMTLVERQTEGELSAEDLHQASDLVERPGRRD
jgi:hypothetical protein